MSPDQQPKRAEPTPVEAGSIVEFGGAGPRSRRRRFNVTAWSLELAADRRVVPLTAVLGGVALFASLISEWQVTDVQAAILADGQAGTKPVATTLADLGAWGGGYLLGVFLLVGATVLVFFGPAPGRRYARLAGLSAGGVLAGILAAMATELGDTSRILGPIFQAGLSADQYSISYGRGLWCAVFGVAALLVALVLAGRHLLAPEIPETARSQDGATREVPTVWSWRRPRAEQPDDEVAPPDEPFDLTVTSTKPFTTEDRDKPS